MTRRTGNAILVFGAAVHADGTPGDPLTRRLRCALGEAALDASALVIVSGGHVQGRPAEAPIMRDWLVAAGVDAARVIVEPEARSTAENARRCADLVADRDIGTVTLVTERFHVRRSRLLLERALAGRHVQVEVRIKAAPDQLGALERIARSIGELTKLAGDLWLSR